MTKPILNVHMSGIYLENLIWEEEYDKNVFVTLDSSSKCANPIKLSVIIEVN